MTAAEVWSNTFNRPVPRECGQVPPEREATKTNSAQHALVTPRHACPQWEQSAGSDRIGSDRIGQTLLGDHDNSDSDSDFDLARLSFGGVRVNYGWNIMNRKYSPEMREPALRMLAESRPDHPTLMSTIRHVASMLGMSPRRCGYSSAAMRSTMANGPD